MYIFSISVTVYLNLVCYYLCEVSPPFEGGRALRNCPAGNFSEEPACRVSLRSDSEGGRWLIDYLINIMYIRLYS